MAPSVVLVIRQDPLRNAQPVEALRIALGLSTGENTVTIILLDNAVRLLSAEVDDIVDTDILEKYLPSLKQLELSFVVPSGMKETVALDPDLSIREASRTDICSLVSAADRVLVF